ncbi:30S ribosomal protein S1 [Candidatus Berkelbacteria bacterium CG10_big_fil_rev_8_21_14_0_10_41_12]|uniref:30S ribosomal protein S1 n=1 Tax=Candidatus Berkelbacteria bacterium CG10_big_fil_rev_8_21_14_0_10_41_12 TaxID=1974513 RepID=A0A2M6WWI9_9BACT|nr:MAG: 30S ribosomal protein S1 [Candidatus Berkelbacteria bacterium CG10_big_fil_rev_8_21_14_0_10_41_12]
MAKAVKDEKKSANSPMDELVENEGEKLIPFARNELAEVTVISVDARKILCDVGGVAFGVVPEREYSFDSREIKPGDTIKASVVSLENRDGLVGLSLRRADKDKIWDSLDKNKGEGSILEGRVKDANRGGLIIEAGGAEGFLPVSQLSVANYPRVEGGDPRQILNKLREMEGKILKIKVISADKESGKLIFSEKAACGILPEVVESLFSEGQEVEGKVTGIAPFGVFVQVGEVEGLIHISEISWERVNDINKLYKVGDTVKAKIIKVEDGKIFLSIKRMLPDPWLEEMKKVKIGKKLQGEVTRVTAYGAFVKLENGLDGLLSLTKEEKGIVEQSRKYEFEVIELKPESRKIGLKLIK